MLRGSSNSGKWGRIGHWSAPVFVFAILFSALAGIPTPRQALASDGTTKADQIGIAGNAFPWEPHWGTFQNLLTESNAGWARIEFRWDHINPQPGTWNWALLDDSTLR